MCTYVTHEQNARVSKEACTQAILKQSQTIHVYLHQFSKGVSRRRQYKSLKEKSQAICTRTYKCIFFKHESFKEASTRAGTFTYNAGSEREDASPIRAPICTYHGEGIEFPDSLSIAQNRPRNITRHTSARPCRKREADLPRYPPAWAVATVLLECRDVPQVSHIHCAKNRRHLGARENTTASFSCE